MPIKFLIKYYADWNNLKTRLLRRLSLRGACDEAIHFTFMDCFAFARNDAKQRGSLALIAILFFFFLLFSPILKAQDFDIAKPAVEKMVLPNGLTVLLLSRPGAPVFSSYLRVKVGNIEEPLGHTGLAHFFEHMAFKGTAKIGTRHPKKEQKLLKEINAIGQDLDQRRALGGRVDELEAIQKELSIKQKKAESLVVKNEFVNIYQRNGGGDLNATTSNDFTSFFVSLPSSKLSLWATLESERLLHPVFREFYEERDVVTEERRMRYENTMDGRLYEAYVTHAFDKSPYKNPVIGWYADIQQLSEPVARDFFNRYYIPSNMVLALVGSFDLNEAKKIITEKFGPLPKKSDPVKPNYPAEGGGDNYPKKVVITGNETPRFYLGFHRPAYPDPDDEIFDVLEKYLCSGRTSRLYQDLVIKKKLATDVGCEASVPGNRLSGLFTFFMKPKPSVTNEALTQALQKIIEDLKKHPIPESELKKVKKQIQHETVWSIKSNMGLASLLTYHELLTGNWEYLLQFPHKVESITPADLQRVVQKYFQKNREVWVGSEQEKK